MRKLVPSLLGVVIASGCVTTGTFEKHKQEAGEREKKLHGEVAALKKQVADLEQQLEAERAKVATATGERDKLRQELDESIALVGELKSRLEKLGQNVDKLASEKGQLAEGLADAKARLEELRKQKALADARAASFNDVIRKLRAMVDAGTLRIVKRGGRLFLALESDVLFESGKVDVKKDGQAALAKVAQVLATVADRKFLVTGHTDDVPMRSGRFASNWELSTARAVEVTRFLIANGMNPKVLAAAGHGEFDPVVANDSPEHRAQNRRIEIELRPNLSELPSLDDVNVEGEKK